MPCRKGGIQMNHAVHGPENRDVTNQDRISKLGSRLMTGITGIGSVFFMLTESVFATDGVTGTIEAGIANGMQDLYNLLKTIAIPIAVVCVVMCAFYIFTGGEKGMEKAKKIGLYTIIGIAVVFLGPILVTTVKSWFSSVSDGGAFSVS